MAAACLANSINRWWRAGALDRLSCIVDRQLLLSGGSGIAEAHSWQHWSPSPGPSGASTSATSILQEQSGYSAHIKHHFAAMSSTTRYKVYTKTGDKGESSLYNGERRPKHDDVFGALGDTDELNSAIGVAREFCLDADNGLPIQLEEIQSRLLDVGSAIATPQDKSSDRKLTRVEFAESNVEMLEGWIDAMDEELPQLTSFILPSGGKAASFLHMARTVCRRSERAVVPLVENGQTDPVVGQFLNRLSDYLFTAARYAAQKEGREETTYKKA